MDLEKHKIILNLLKKGHSFSPDLSNVRQYRKNTKKFDM